MNYDAVARTTADRTQKVMDRAQDAAERASVYVQQQLETVSERTRDLARAVSDGIEDYTGRSVDVWSDARDYARAHPVQMLAAMVAVGYIVGKILLRPSSDA
jgi:ElaB/YqjD/DUF883 family membrane-anchored ribosome-binding protein